MTVIRTTEGRRKSVVGTAEAEQVLQGMIRGFTPQEEAILGEMLCGGDADGLVACIERARWARRPVSIEQFLEDPYFLGESCQTLFPGLRNDLVTLFNGTYREIVVTGGLGVGKTTALAIIICRLLYELSCMANPHASYGLSPGSELVIPLISKTLNLSTRVLMSAVEDKIRLSPYFMREFTPRFRVEEVSFPQNIKLIRASYMSDRILGTNVIAMGLDEANFPPGKRKQVISHTVGTTVTEAHFDVVEKLYLTLLKRIKSRIMRGGDTPGMVVLTSSAGTINSFIDRRIRDAANDPLCFVRDHTAWTVNSETKFLGPKFRVLCGSSATQSRILGDDEEVDEVEVEARNGMIIEIPVEWKGDFERDLEEALRDVAGISTMAISAYLQRVEALEACVRPDRVHPFGVETWTAGTNVGFRWDLMLRVVQRRTGVGTIEEHYQPLRNPGAPRWIHIDPSLSGDATGMSMAHISHWVQVERRMPDGRLVTELSPFYVFDFVLRIIPRPGEQIFLGDVRQLVHSLQDHGYYIMGVSTDDYQSADTRQQLKHNANIHTELLSVDNTTAPYDALKAAIYEGRVELYNYEPLFAELRSLEYNRDRGKIDHPAASSKDIADSAAGAVWGLSQHIGEMPLERRLFDSEDLMDGSPERLQQSLLGDRIVGPVDAQDLIQRQQATEWEDELPLVFL